MRFVLVLQGFVDVGRFARRMLAACKTLKKTVFSDSKIVAQGVPGNLERASLSAKWPSRAKKCPRSASRASEFFEVSANRQLSEKARPRASKERMDAGGSEGKFRNLRKDFFPTLCDGVVGF